MHMVGNRTFDCPRSWIEQQLVGVKAQPKMRLKRAMHPKTITLPQLAPWQISMPDITAAGR
jgi:hypothetical protein